MWLRERSVHTEAKSGNNAIESTADFSQETFKQGSKRSISLPLHESWGIKSISLSLSGVDSSGDLVDVGPESRKGRSVLRCGRVGVDGRGSRVDRAGVLLDLGVEIVDDGVGLSLLGLASLEGDGSFWVGCWGGDGQAEEADGGEERELHCECCGSGIVVVVERWKRRRRG